MRNPMRTSILRWRSLALVLIFPRLPRQGPAEADSHEAGHEPGSRAAITLTPAAWAAADIRTAKAAMLVVQPQDHGPGRARVQCPAPGPSDGAHAGARRARPGRFRRPGRRGAGARRNLQPRLHVAAGRVSAGHGAGAARLAPMRSRPLPPRPSWTARASGSSWSAPPPPKWTASPRSRVPQAAAGGPRPFRRNDHRSQCPGGGPRRTRHQPVPPGRSVGSLGSLHIREKDMAALQAGSAAEMRTQAYPGEVFRGRLLLIGDVLDAETRTVIGRVEGPNPAGKVENGDVSSRLSWPASSSDPPWSCRSPRFRTMTAGRSSSS